MNLLPPLKKTQIILQIAIFLCISLAFSLLVIKDFSGSLGGAGDIESWEYIGFYFKNNLTFTPLPTLNLVNNQVFYPYGVSNVFQTWGLERDIFYSIFSSLFGHGPWLQIYYLLTVLITAIGAFALLVRDYGFARATGAGFLVSFFNFYAIHKYPGHFNMAVVHWTTLSLIADFLIVKRVVLRQHLSLRLILIRCCLLILSLGQDGGYVAGLALMSLTVSSIFIIGLLIRRTIKGEHKLTKLIESVLASYQRDFLAYPRTCLILLTLSIIIGLIYIPLLMPIFKEAKGFDFFEMAPTTAWWNNSKFRPLLKLFGLSPGQGFWWANPSRLLIPFLPGFNPGQPWVHKLLNDSPEAIGSASPGWFLLILGILGLWQARKRIAIFMPLLSILIVCLLYHPKYFPILKIFPWFSFYRVAGRSTIIYAVILCLFALEVNLDYLRPWRKKLVAAFLVLLACTELYTVYSFKVVEHPEFAQSAFISEHLPYKPYKFDRSFFNYMNYVKNQPGEAVLDWPFCAAGANGVGGKFPLNRRTCPYHKLTMIFALRRFHEKKVMGQLFSRLHPSQLEPYLQAGWDKLFSPNGSNWGDSTRERRCFNANQWAFFTDFYKFNDFAGINLYVDLLPDSCVAEFHARFGQPAIATVVPQAGRVEFIPKSSELKSQVNPALGVRLKFNPA